MSECGLLAYHRLKRTFERRMRRPPDVRSANIGDTRSAAPVLHVELPIAHSNILKRFLLWPMVSAPIVFSLSRASSTPTGGDGPPGGPSNLPTRSSYVTSTGPGPLTASD